MKQLLKKKLQGKKGFTLAELLIVVAIVAILAAIAIPTFTASLEEARLATDDANIRSALAVCKVGQLTGGIELGTSGSITKPDASDTFYFLTTGNMSDTDSGTYTLKAGHSSCPVSTSTHTKGAKITIVFTKGTGNNADTWTLNLA